MSAWPRWGWLLQRPKPSFRHLAFLKKEENLAIRSGMHSLDFIIWPTAAQDPMNFTAEPSTGNSNRIHLNSPILMPNDPPAPKPCIPPPGSIAPNPKSSNQFLNQNP